MQVVLKRIGGRSPTPRSSRLGRKTHLQAKVAFGFRQMRLDGFAERAGLDHLDHARLQKCTEELAKVRAISNLSLAVAGMLHACSRRVQRIARQPDTAVRRMAPFFRFPASANEVAAELHTCLRSASAIREKSLLRDP